jgi:hydrogenase small subunit
MTNLEQQLAREGVSRRQFLKFCGAMVATLALPARYVPRVAEALTSAMRPPLVWLEFQDCAGDTESFLRASQPSVDDLLLETISLDYHETIMVPAGLRAEKSLADTVANYAGEYICIVEGAIPTAEGGVYCTIRGRTALSIAQEVCGKARATIAVGSCAWDGGLPAAAPNPTGATGVRGAVPGLTQLVSLPGCPANVVNLTATLVHFLTFGELPSRDERGRPRFAYGEEIHEECERRRHYKNDRFVREWGDEGHRRGWCLKKMGCKGPETHHNCPSVLWNQRAGWPVGAGHGCIGCTEPHFWDRHAPMYREMDDDDDHEDDD